MKLYCFPKEQSRCLLYSSYKAFKTRLFSDFILQASPKNSLFFRYRSTWIGHLIGGLFKTDLEVPVKNVDYIGIRKGRHVTLAELEHNIPKQIWKKSGVQDWVKEPFLGYQIIPGYSLKKIKANSGLLEKALRKQWQRVCENPENIHGDFTHFNILYDEQGKIHLIDKVKMNNSVLFDFFYFYSYLMQCVSKRIDLSDTERRAIKIFLQALIRKICIYDSPDHFHNDFKSISIPDITGIDLNKKDEYLNEFEQIFTFSDI